MRVSTRLRSMFWAMLLLAAIPYSLFGSTRMKVQVDIGNLFS